MPGKASDAEIEQRLSEIENLVLYGAGRQEILRYASKWVLSNRQVETYMERAWERIHEAVKASRQENISRTLKRLNEALKRAIALNDVKAEIKAIEIQAKILGLEIAPAEQAPRLELPNEALDAMIVQESVH